MVGNNGLEPLRRAVRAAEVSGAPAKVVRNNGNAPGHMAELLNLLRPGDILTHAFSGAGSNTVQNGRMLPAAPEAKRSEVVGVGHGGGSFDHAVSEPARVIDRWRARYRAGRRPR